jgi:hypothetical protein
MVTKAAIFVFVVIAITMFTVISVKAQLATDSPPPKVLNSSTSWDPRPCWLRATDYCPDNTYIPGAGPELPSSMDDDYTYPMDDGYTYPKNATEEQKKAIDEQELQAWLGAGKPGSIGGGNPYCVSWH